jgi:uncharacterized repeat protein (TIGR03803 family)
MQSQKLSIGFAVLLGIFAVTTLVTATAAAAQTEKVLYSFGHENEYGIQPAAGLVVDAAGNLFGTTQNGSVLTLAGGTVFELTKMCGHWTEKVLHHFGGGEDGASPLAGLILDAAGSLYGTTQAGGAYNSGTVFELSPTADGGWTEKVLHSFNPDGKDGIAPLAGLVFDAKGNLYGTTVAGGSNCGQIGGCGTVFQLSHSSSGGLTEKILHDFGSRDDGVQPRAGLIFDSTGNLYGTTYHGGSSADCGSEGCGTVFELTPGAGGGWTETILHNFDDTSTDGALPNAGLILDGDGNLYGTTVFGGAFTSTSSCQMTVGRGGCGTVFELTHAAGGDWTVSILHSFEAGATDGSQPLAGLIFDASGNLYGTTAGGGEIRGGTVFKLTPAAGEVWNETLLYRFGPSADKGFLPEAGLIFDTAGNLYGTTQSGGVYNLGAVFEVTP